MSKVLFGTGAIKEKNKKKKIWQRGCAEGEKGGGGESRGARVDNREPQFNRMAQTKHAKKKCSQ